MNTNIILAGVGGQGILSIATILGKAALDDNLYIKQAEVHGMSQRGGDVQSNLRISSSPISSDLIPLREANLIVSLEPMEALRYLPYLSDQGWIVTNTVPFVNIPNYPEQTVLNDRLDTLPRVLAFDMDEVAKQVATLRASNMVLLGAASRYIDIEQHKIEKAITDIFSTKGTNIVEMNIKAFRAGRVYKP